MRPPSGTAPGCCSWPPSGWVKTAPNGIAGSQCQPCPNVDLSARVCGAGNHEAGSGSTTRFAGAPPSEARNREIVHPIPPILLRRRFACQDAVPARLLTESTWNEGRGSARHHTPQGRRNQQILPSAFMMPKPLEYPRLAEVATAACWSFDAGRRADGQLAVGHGSPLTLRVSGKK
jgi:hypothetical protein